jgi:hypothetical protein
MEQTTNKTLLDVKLDALNAIEASPFHPTEAQKFRVATMHVKKHYRPQLHAVRGIDKTRLTYPILN